jgi:hypothetical protein
MKSFGVFYEPRAVVVVDDDDKIKIVKSHLMDLFVVVVDAQHIVV